jgi:regulator of sigma E protease
MDTFIQIAQLLLALTILVFVHELGHFMAARMFGIRVDKFFIFFDAWGKKLWSVKRGGTEYGIGWLPLGGYVKIAGMIDESMDTEQMNRPPQSWEFRSKPNWQKFIVMIAGIVMNVILGIVIFIFYLNRYEKHYTTVDSVNEHGGIYAYSAGKDYGFKTGDKLLTVNGKHYKRYNDYASQRVYFGADVEVERDGKNMLIDIPGDAFKQIMAGKLLYEIKNVVTVDSLSAENTNARNAGISAGDIIKQINGKEISGFGELAETLDNFKNQIVNLTVERRGDIHDLTVPVDSTGKIGFYPSLRLFPYDSVKYSIAKSISYGSRDAFEIFYFQAIGLWKIITGQIPAAESIQSPIGITKFFPTQWDWAAFWRMTALLSMVLAFMNLLPIPALDGGHIMFIAIESITRRKLSDKFLERAQIVGMVILLSLMVFAVGNDLFKIFNK